MRMKMIKICSLLLISAIASGCSIFQKEKDDDSKFNMVAIAALFANATKPATGTSRDIYTGFADIPASIYQTATTSTSASIQAESRTLASTDYKFVGSSSSVSSVYDLVRTTAKTTRDITKSIGDLVSTLEAIPVSSTSTTALTGTRTWNGVQAKYQYQASTVLTGGKKLEVWYNGDAPQSTNKAIELNYLGSSSSGSITGFVFLRFLTSATATTMSKAYIKFDYNSTTKTRTMVVILQGIGTLFTDNAHFFVQEVDGVTTMDGTYTVKDYNANAVAGTATGVTASARAYAFSAIGNSSKGIVRAAFPLTTDTTVDLYSNTSIASTGAVGVPGLANIGQVWTNFVLANTTTVSTVNAIGGVCGSTFITSTSATGGNPTSFTGITTVGILKTCLDSIIASGQTTSASVASGVKNLYYLTNIRNPAYYNLSGSTATLYGVESLDASDANKTEFDTLENNTAFLNYVRTTSNTTYPASFDAVNVAALNLFTGAGVPSGTSATNLTNLNARWGDGNSTGTASTATAGSNFINGSSDNTAPTTIP